MGIPHGYVEGIVPVPLEAHGSALHPWVYPMATLKEEVNEGDDFTDRVASMGISYGYVEASRASM